ncbi:MAG: ribonuclease E/G, partial [Lachnospiraceae bacterium]|nr:ribonuclease E/G [Lachnospiraceae bacterium]
LFQPGYGLGGFIVVYQYDPLSSGAQQVIPGQHAYDLFNVEKKTPEEIYLKTNLEAAAEIAVQMRLRNLSGIIIVDFIDMKEEAHNAELLNVFRQHLSQDPVKTTLVDMTALGLVEVTRKKVRQPLYEQLK